MSWEPLPRSGSDSNGAHRISFQTLRMDEIGSRSYLSRRIHVRIAPLNLQKFVNVSQGMLTDGRALGVSGFGIASTKKSIGVQQQDVSFAHA